MKTCLTAMALLLTAASASAAPTAYAINPAHTFPSFEADHLGISVWRGKDDGFKMNVDLRIQVQAIAQP